jgi:thioredoxin reductase (NADPH)
MGRFRRRTLVLDDGRGRWSYGQHNDNYLGFPGGVSARRLHALGVAQAGRFGVGFRNETATGVEEAPFGFRIRATRRSYAARTLIWAAGVQDHWPEFRNALRLVGTRLFWCIVCDGWRTLERRVLLLGNDDKAVRTTLQFRTYTRQLTLIVDPDRGSVSRAARDKLLQAGIKLRRCRVRGAHEEDGALSVALEDGTRERCEYVFSLLGSQPRIEPLAGLAVERARNGHLRIDDKNRTSLRGFFAAGDVTNKHSHQIVSAVHEGATAAQAANQLLYPDVQKL